MATGMDFIRMPNGQVYARVEISACELWWLDLELSQRWWMITEVYPGNPINERIRCAVAPFTGQIAADGTHLVKACFVANGSTEAEARIRLMRQMAKLTL